MYKCAKASDVFLFTNSNMNIKTDKEMKILIKNGFDINGRIDMLKNTLLHKAVLSNNLELIKILINNNSLHLENYRKMTPIFYVKSKEAFNLLIDKYGIKILTDYSDENKTPIEINNLIKIFLVR